MCWAMVCILRAAQRPLRVIEKAVVSMGKGYLAAGNGTGNV